MKRAVLTTILLSFVAIIGFGQDLDRGMELYRKNDFSEAEPVFRKVVEQQGDNARGNRYLGLTLVELKKPAEAEPFLKKADELESNGDTKAALARLYVEQKDYDKAEATIQGVDSEEAPYVRGLIAFHKKQFQDSARDLEAYSESHPDHAYAHYYAGMAYNGLKRPDKMLSHFEMFLRLKPDAPEARKIQSVMKAIR